MLEDKIAERKKQQNAILISMKFYNTYRIRFCRSMGEPLEFRL